MPWLAHRGGDPGASCWWWWWWRGWLAGWLWRACTCYHMVCEWLSLVGLVKWWPLTFIPNACGSINCFRWAVTVRRQGWGRETWGAARWWWTVTGATVTSLHEHSDNSHDNNEKNSVCVASVNTDTRWVRMCVCVCVCGWGWVGTYCWWRQQPRPAAVFTSSKRK